LEVSEEGVKGLRGRRGGESGPGVGKREDRFEGKDAEDRGETK